MLTPSDIRNPKRQSGFNYVGKNGDVPKPYQADANRGSGKNQRAYKGPRRATALEAAQDYCDFMNAGGASATPLLLKSAGHNGKRDRLPDDPEIQAALGVLRDARGQREGRQGYVYLIVEDVPRSIRQVVIYGKIGYSTNPTARVAELQTGNPRPLKLLYAMEGTPDDEARLHTKYHRLNVLQEWFYVTKELVNEFPVKAAV